MQKKVFLRLGLESRAVSILVAKVAPYPSRSHRLKGIFSWLRRLHINLESRAVSTLISKFAPTSVAKSGMNVFWFVSFSALVWKVVLSPPWSRKSRNGRSWLLDRETRKRAVSNWVTKTARDFFGRAVSKLVAPVAPFHELRWSRRLRLGSESLEVANLGRESLDLLKLGCNKLFAPSPFRSRKSRRIIVVA